MDKFQTFHITGSPETIQQILAVLVTRSTNGWHRSVERERSISAGKDLYCFECDARGERSDATLWISTKEKGTILYDTTIVPITKTELTIGQCNIVLKSFVADVVEPVIAGYGVHVDISGDTFNVRDYISEPTEAKLKAFSSMANKSTGSSHPSDRDRWFGFILACHNENATLHAEDLRIWLRDNGWDDELSFDLCVEYEFGRNLLTARDQTFGK